MKDDCEESNHNIVNNKRKRKKKKQNKNVRRAIPLVSGVTASSLVKQKSQSNIANKNKNKKQRRSSSSLSSAAAGGGGFTNTQESLEIISKYHTINKRIEQNKYDPAITNEKERRLNEQSLQQELLQLGGIDAYQKASMYGAKSSKFVCANWVVPFILLQQQQQEQQQLKEDKQRQQQQQQQQQHHRVLRILDVGAIDNQYKKYSSRSSSSISSSSSNKVHNTNDGMIDIDVVPIDLHGGQDESVLQIDYFDYVHEYCLQNDMYSNNTTGEGGGAATTTTTTELSSLSLPLSSQKQSPPPNPPPEPFDAVVMSLVLNFQGDPRKRGDMLALAADPKLLRPPSKSPTIATHNNNNNGSNENNINTHDNNNNDGGILFVALPSASLDNSRYCNLQRFVEVCTTLGFDLIEKKRSLKLILLIFRRSNRGCRASDNDKDNDDTAKKTRGRRRRRPVVSSWYDASSRSFDYGNHEMKRLTAKPGKNRNNFAVILKSTANRA